MANAISRINGAFRFIAGRTLVFFDEVQKFRENIVAAAPAEAGDIVAIRAGMQGRSES